ncbi:pyridoxal phosphate-dependent aminotransferase [Rhodovulum sulfidophilum]|uniref:pyridoxal phosphate-dependent aminotransferase n=2 Tax=Rhodovulum sulfidophilum TaxID=35806 RepID=UPI001F2EB220|nr:pyridoxal phosphate-dependent aminotransferase [Rhodovulum sulfidophilum]MCE8440118.1 pyridoxal phosphate-dependent aminotransferase [Rhodovulum sulfidophilum]
MNRADPQTAARSVPDPAPDPVSRRMRDTKPSASLEAAQLARDLRGQGRRVISLATGEPDFPTPDHIKAACVTALAENRTGYPPVQGIPALREAICQKFHLDNDLDYRASEVIVANGVKQIIFNALAASLEPGQEVLIPAPGWVSYSEMARLNGGVPVWLETRWDDNFRLRPEALEAAITENTRWLILNNPCNPTGTILTEAEIRALAEVLERHPQVMVLSDDIYEHLRYGSAPYFTIAQTSEAMKARTLTANGVSKAWCMTGWRVGFAAGPQALIDAMRTYQGQTTGGVMHPAQFGALAALTGSRCFMGPNLEAFRARRALGVQLINETEGLSCHAPDGAFYLFVNCAPLIGATRPDGGTIASDADLTRYFVEEAEVVCVPGAAFGLSPFFRISFACGIEVLEEACLKLRAAVARLTPAKEGPSA